MKTIIVKENGNEIIKSDLKFRVKMNSKKLDGFIHQTYSSAKSRIDTLSKIFKHSTFEILVIE